MIKKHNYTYDNNLVSIIIPAHNSEKYILKCLKSLQVQSYNNIEITIVNDGSTDQTQKIIEDFVKTDGRFFLINQKNAGVSSARNVGIKASKGKYLLFVDSDDYVAPDYVETLIALMEQGNYELACADYYKVINGVIYGRSADKSKIEVLSREDAINLLHNKQYFQGYLWNKIFMKEIIIQNCIYFDPDIKIWEDMQFCLKYLIHIKKIVHINKSIYFYVDHAESTMNDSSVWREYTQLKALEGMWNLLQPYNGTFKEYIRNYYANTLVGLIGKKTCFNDREILCRVKNLHGRLTMKHYLKLCLYRNGLNWIIQLYSLIKIKC